MWSFVVVLIIIYGVNCDNVHKGLESALESNNGHLSEDVLAEGVDLDVTFVSSSQNISEYPSHHHCPSPTDGYPWVKYGYGTPEKCYLAGFQGPCPLHMKLFYNSSSKTGYCQCDCFPNNVPNKAEPFCMKFGLERKILRPFSFFPQAGLCYPLFSQGPCKYNKWFVLDPSTMKAKCKKRRCRNQRKSNEIIFFSYNTSSCHMLDDICTPEQNSVQNTSSEHVSYREKYYRYTFVEGHWDPQCIYCPPSSGLVPTPLPLPPPGASGGAILPSSCDEDEIYSKLLRKCLQPYTISKVVG